MYERFYKLRERPFALTPDPDYLYPHEKSRPIPGAKSARAFVLGPPHDVDKIDDLDPIGDETFGDDTSGEGLALDAATTRRDGGKASLFPRRYVLPPGEVFTDSVLGPFFTQHYGTDGPEVDEQVGDGDEVRTSAAWRRMTSDDAADAAGADGDGSNRIEMAG